MTHAMPATAPVDAPALTSAIQAHLGQLLRIDYEAMETETPARFVELLALLEKADTDRGEAEEEFKDGMLAAVPSLRAFAVSLCRNPVRADDLVQDTLVKAWRARDRFERGTNLGAWLFTILRNQFFSDIRKKVREVEDADGVYAAGLSSRPEQGHALDLADMRKALERLPAEQRRALVMVGAEGMSYEDVAEACGVAVGTIKSRVNRARGKLAELLGLREGDLAPAAE